MEGGEDIERHSNLRPVVDRYLAGGLLTETELSALRAYLVRFIEGKRQTIARLADEVQTLDGRDDFVRWFREARLHDFDPVE